MSWARWSIRKSRTRSWVMEDRLSQVVSDVTKVAEETKTAATSQGQKIVGPQGPLKHVVSQGSEESVPKISAEEMIKHWDRFSVVYGRDPRPEEECTGDQLTGVDTSLKRDIAPYVDFGIWVPDRHRLLKMLRNTGLQVHVGRVLRHIEISGPADFTSWSECYSLSTIALVGFDAVGLGPMHEYSRLIGRYATRHMERLWSVFARNSVAAMVRGQAPAGQFDASRQWESVWWAAADDKNFWHEQFEEPALIILTQAGRGTDVVTGEAPIESNSVAGHTQYEPDRKKRKTETRARPDQQSSSSI